MARFSAALCAAIALLASTAGPANAQPAKGDRVAFINGISSGAQDVFTVPASGGALHQLTHIGDILQARWSPAGNKAALHVLPFGTIALVDPDGSHQRTVADDGALGAFSPDGRQLAITRFINESYDIWSVDVATGSQRKLVGFGSGFSGFTSALAWSPDSRKLAYQRVDCVADETGCGTPFVAVVNADGSGRHRLASGYAPTWAPSGRELAFVGPTGDIRIIDASGGTPRTVATGGFGYPGAVAWQPHGNGNGASIAYLTGDASPLTDTFAVALVSPKGKQQARLPLHHASAFAVEWSPSGKQLTFGTLRETPDGLVSDVFVVDEHFRQLRNVSNTGVAFGPTFAPGAP